MRLEDLKKNPKEVRKQAMEIIARKAIQTEGPASVKFLKKDVKRQQKASVTGVEGSRGREGREKSREEPRFETEGH